MFAYITASPFLFIREYGLTPGSYTIVFSTNVTGLIGAAVANRRLVGRYGSVRLARLGVGLMLAAGAALLGVAVTGVYGWRGLLPPLFVYIASISFVGPNAFAAALASSGKAGGTGSALAGCLQFATAAVAGLLVASFGTASAVPLGMTMAVFAITGAIALRLADRVGFA
jgi:DHA1 family bicyclomycin/chloramphenicol resistance-like MFS transporter